VGLDIFLLFGLQVNPTVEHLSFLLYDWKREVNHPLIKTPYIKIQLILYMHRCIWTTCLHCKTGVQNCKQTKCVNKFGTKNNFILDYLSESSRHEANILSKWVWICSPYPPYTSTWYKRLSGLSLCRSPFI
jgi:hypothetical protein